MNSLKKVKYLILIIIIIAILVMVGYFFIFNNYIKVNHKEMSFNSNLYKNEIPGKTENGNIIDNTEISQQTEDNNIDTPYLEQVVENLSKENTNESNSNLNKKSEQNSNRIKVHSFGMEKIIENGKKTIEQKISNIIKQTKKTDVPQNEPEDSDPIIEYRVMFRTNGGNAISSVYVEENEKVSKPAQDPIKNNTTFIDWFTDKELKSIYDFNTPVTKNIILYAGWRADVDSSIVTAVNNFNLKNTKINKNGHAIAVYFSNLDIDVLSMESALTGLFKNASNSNSYQNVSITYKGRGFDYLNYSEKLVPLRFIGWFGKDIWSGSYGFDCKSGDFIGKTFNIEIKLKEGYLSENNNKSENYQVSFES